MNTKTFTGVDVKDADKGLVSLVYSTLGKIDADGDVASKSTFAEGAPVLVSAYGHGSWDGALPVGKGAIRTTDTEAIADIQFNLQTAAGRETFETVKFSGPLQEWSYSLENTVRKAGELDGVPCMFIESTTIKEVSPVLRGAGTTRTLTVKSADLTFSEHAETVLADVGMFITRASEVVALRAEKGKTISAPSLELLKRLQGELLVLEALFDEPTTDPSSDDALNAELLQLELGSIAGTL